jgi:hypothetical protein
MPELKASLTVSTPHATSISSLTDRTQWALPVRFEKLVAHMEAFEETLPAITTLRLCNRFGQGANCHIHKLPLELVELVGEFVVEPERERRLVVWSKMKKCWDRKCIYWDDHPIPAEHGGCSCYECAREECKIMSHPLNLNGHVCLAKPHRCFLTDPYDRLYRERCTHDKTRSTTCLDNKVKFENEFSSRGPLYKQESLLKRHFGIGIWVTQISFNVFNVDKWAVLAYVTLPDHHEMREGWGTRANSDLSTISGFAVPVHLSATPSLASLERFPKALKRLGLKPFIHRAQKHIGALSVAQSGEEVSEGEEKVSEGEEEVSEGEEEVSRAMEESARSGKGHKKAETWPQLIMLMKSDPYDED